MGYKTLADERMKILSSLGLDTSELKNWVVKWTALKTNAKIRDSECKLSFEEYLQLASEAGITNPNQIGKKREQFQMGRLGDVGVYELGNCRFITQRQNILERTENGGTKLRAAMSAARKGLNKYIDETSAKIANSKSRFFRVISPEGIVYEGKNLKEFCKEDGLCQGWMSAVCRGAKKQYKGWTGEYLNVGTN